MKRLFSVLQFKQGLKRGGSDVPSCAAQLGPARWSNFKVFSRDCFGGHSALLLEKYFAVARSESQLKSRGVLWPCTIADSLRGASMKFAVSFILQSL